MLIVSQRGRGGTIKLAGKACPSCIIMGGAQADRNGARSCCQSPTGNAVRKIISRKVRWIPVVEMVPTCSSAEYKEEERTDSWTVIVHVCTCHVLPDIGLIYIRHIFCVLVKGAKISK